MKTYFLDFETYYENKTYTLRTMTPVEYILDPRFEVIGCAVKEGYNGPNRWIDGPDFQAWIDTLDPKDTHMVSFNALFDACIVAWRYKFIPRLTSCTMSIARSTIGHLLRRHDLKTVASTLGLPAKGDAIHKVSGMHAADIKAAGIWDEYVAYGLNDNELNAGIWDKLVRSGLFPISELAVLDMVIRCAIKPKFVLDQQVLVEHLNEVQQGKEKLLAQAMLLGADGPGALRSDKKFAELLRGVGCEPPMKISLTTGEDAYAFAKTDTEFMDLEQHENPAVQVLVSARLGHKTTIEESRTERFLKIANLDWPDGSVGLMPIPLNYGAAHTHRLGGAWKLNPQNMRRGGKLRSALTAPEDHKVVVPDSSQIEARLVAELAGQEDLVAAFANGEDVYASFASEVYGRPINKKDNPGERFSGKVGVLQLGFGSSWQKFKWSLAVQSKAQLGYALEISDEEAILIVNTYRKKKYIKIPQLWRSLQYTGLPALLSGAEYQLGPCIFHKGYIELPSGLRLTYHNLRQSKNQWFYDYGNETRHIYGGALLENIVQALSRCCTFESALRIQKHEELAMQVHDELVYIVPDERVDAVKALVLEEMCRRPTWLPNLPLAAECEAGQNYGEAK
jgi:DNA polymerase family A